MTLTDAKIRTLQPKDKAYKVSDFGGLYLNVTPKGSKLWKLKYRFNGKEGKLSFGPYPDISLKEARALKDTARSHLANGVNPARAKQDGKVERSRVIHHTFNKIADEFEMKAKKDGKSDATLRKLTWPSGDAHADFGHMPMAETMIPPTP